VYKITGRNLSRDKVERAVALSDEKYCSATAQLRALAKISHEIEIIEAE
jgi:putative redox protein